MKRYLFAAVLFLFLQGCADTLVNPDAADSDLQIQITSPASNDTVGYRGSRIEYSLKTTASVNFIELYINDNFIENFPPLNNQKPAININLDSSYESKRIELYLVFYGKNGTSYKSNVVKNLFVSGDKTLPSRPFNLKIIPVSSSVLNISWEDHSPYINEYEIWRKEGLNGIFEKRISAPGTAKNINDENLVQGTEYFYKIRGISKNGISDFSDIISSTGSGGSSEVPAPGNLTAVIKDLHIVYLIWKDNSINENYFKVERRREWTAFETIGYAEKNIQSYTDSSAAGGIEFFYRVKAISEKDSSWSNEAYLFMPSYILKAPELLSAENKSSIRVLVTWRDNDQNYADFVIERKSENGSFVIAGRASGTGSSFSDTVHPNINYIYRIKQDDGIYNSPYSNELGVSTQVIPLPAPQNPNGYFDGVAMVVSWQFNSDAGNFIIERRDSTAGTSFSEVGRTGGPDREFKDYSTVCQHIYIYRIKASDPYSESPWSSEKVLKNWNICP